MVSKNVRSPLKDLAACWRDPCVLMHTALVKRIAIAKPPRQTSAENIEINGDSARLGSAENIESATGSLPDAGAR